MPTEIHPMLAISIDKPFDGPDWLFEIKWDGYRAVAFVDNGKVRLVSRNQNELTARYPELKDLAKSVKAKTVILDGEVVALDDQGRPSFSLMQQRTGFRPGGRRGPTNAGVPVLYYAFDLLYLDGYDWRKLPLEERKKKLASILIPGDSIRFSDHYERKGITLFEMAKEKGLEGILAKKRDSIYQERRSNEWLKIKIRHRLDRRLHPARRQPRQFRLRRPGTLRQARPPDPHRTSGQRLQPKLPRRNLEDAESARDQAEALLRRSRSPQKSALGEAGTRSGNRIRRMDRRRQRRHWPQTPRSRIPGPAR
jgi:hypothetical protein